MNLPPALREAIEAEQENIDGVIGGAEFLYQLLFRAAPAFNEDAAFLELERVMKWERINDKPLKETSRGRSTSVDLARWQHAQSQAAMAAAKNELASMEHSYKDLAAYSEKRIQELEQSLSLATQDCDSWKASYKTLQESANGHIKELERQLAEAKSMLSGKTFDDELIRERATAGRLRECIDWLRDGIQHFTADEDHAQVEHLTKHIDEVLE